jgi:thiol-disulfide isomerase/thioredoxin
MKSKNLILLVVLVIIVGSIYYLENSKAKPSDVKIIEDDLASEVDELGGGKSVGENELGDGINPVNGKPTIKGGYILAPKLTGISSYLNTDGKEVKISDYEGKVVLIDFWTYTCINCIRTLPYLTAWDTKYKDQGLVIIGVHTPEFEFEKERENVEAAMEKYGIEYIVVQDNDYLTWQAFKNRYWPHKYLIDSDGYIRYDHIGEGRYEETELMIQELLLEIGEVTNAVIQEQNTSSAKSRTPELYAGFDFSLPRGQDIGNDGGLQVRQSYDYQVPLVLDKDIIYLSGNWKSNPDDLEAMENEVEILLSYMANSVNIVADSLHSVRLEVFIDNEYISSDLAGDDVKFVDGKSFVMVDTPQLYNLVDGEYGEHNLKLVASKGFKFNAFTFG